MSALNDSTFIQQIKDAEFVKRSGSSFWRLDIPMKFNTPYSEDKKDLMLSYADEFLGVLDHKLTTFMKSDQRSVCVHGHKGFSEGLCEVLRRLTIGDTGIKGFKLGQPVQDRPGFTYAAVVTLGTALYEDGDVMRNFHSLMFSAGCVDQDNLNALVLKETFTMIFHYLTLEENLEVVKQGLDTADCSS